MADFSRDPREHWLKPRFSENEVANSGYIIFFAFASPNHCPHGIEKGPVRIPLLDGSVRRRTDGRHDHVDFPHIILISRYLHEKDDIFAFQTHTGGDRPLRMPTQTGVCPHKQSPQTTVGPVPTIRDSCGSRQASPAIGRPRALQRAARMKIQGSSQKSSALLPPSKRKTRKSKWTCSCSQTHVPAASA